MTAPVLSWSLERDAANLLALWLLIHGPDPAPDQVDATLAVSTDAYAAALTLVTTLAGEFAETALTEHAQVSARMQQRFGVDPLPTKATTNQAPWTSTRVCLAWPYHDANGVEKVEQLCIGSPVDPLAFV